LWEQVITRNPKQPRSKEQLVVAPALPLDKRVEALERQLEEIMDRINVINARLDTLQQATLGGVKMQPPPSLVQPSQTVQSPTTGLSQAKRVHNKQRTLGELRESMAGLRRKLVEVETRLAEMEKQGVREEAFWKDKYEELREAVRGAIPPSRVWKSWTLGPQRYVQENLRILREFEPESQ
jgi:predicted  nucleic acid-binding Zn-ribbon protein